MGHVYRVWDPELLRDAAIKTVADMADAVGHREQILAEARALAQLSHPNVVTVYDVVVLDDQVLLVMELVEGSTVREWLVDESPEPDAVVDAIVQAARGLAAAHQAGLVHRDIKPDNLLRAANGRIRVADFGLATAAPSGEPTGFMGPAGSPAYVAPAQLRGAPADAASDQYALCMTLFEGLYGRRPHDDPRPGNDSDVQARDSAVHRPPDRRRVSPRLWACIARGLDPRADRRFRSVTAFADALEASSRPRRRWPLVVVGGAITTGLIVGWPADVLCEDGASSVATVWNPSIRSKVTGVLAGEAQPDALVVTTATDRLDEYERRWRRTYADACIVDKGRSAAFDRALACLRRQQDGLEAVVDVLAEPDPQTAARAPQLTEGLPDPAGCLDDDDDPPTLDRGFSASLSRARALFRVGRDDEARVLLDGLGLTVDDPRAVAEVMLTTASLKVTGGDVVGGRDDLVQVFLTAQAHRLDRLALRAAIELVHVEGHELADRRAGRRWAREAEARLPADGRASAPVSDLRTAQGVLEFAAGNYDLAQDHFETAIDAIEEPRPLTEAYLTERMGVLAKERGRYGEAVSLHERALATRRELLGSRHPDVGESLFNLATAHQGEGHVDDARRLFHEARLVFEQTLGPEHALVGAVHNNLGTLEGGQGDHAAALEHFESALRIMNDTDSADSPAAGSTLLNAGMALQALGRPEQARIRMQRALRLLEERLGPNHLEVAYAVHGLGHLERSEGRHAHSVPLLERAVAIARAKLGLDHPATLKFEAERDQAQRDASARAPAPHPQ